MRRAVECERIAPAFGWRIAATRGDDPIDRATTSYYTRPYTKFLAVTPTRHCDTMTLLLYNIRSSSVSSARHRSFELSFFPWLLQV